MLDSGLRDSEARAAEPEQHHLVSQVGPGGVLTVAVRTAIRLIASLVLIPFLIGACSSQEPAPPFSDTMWQWTEIVETDPTTEPLTPNPENYTIRFSVDGSLAFRADCNRGEGSYTLDGRALSIELGGSSLVRCRDDSLDDLYRGFLGEVAGYSLVNGQLVLELKDDAGRMIFNEG